MPGQKYYLMHSPRESNFILVKLYPFEPVIWCSICLYDRPTLDMQGATVYFIEIWSHSIDGYFS